MRYVRLIACCDEFDNRPGLALRGANTSADGFMADREGVLLAHDVLEHVNGADKVGPVWDEMEALGAIWQVRGRHGDLMTKYPSRWSIAENIASDLTRMFPQWIAESHYCGPDAGRVGVRAHRADSDFRETIEHSRREIPNEHGANYWGDMWGDVREQIEPYLLFALQRMRVGYSKAQRRYGAHYHGANMFYHIREAVAEALNHLELIEGFEYTLAYDSGEARIYPRGESEFY